MVLGKTQICLDAPALLERLAQKPQGAKNGKPQTGRLDDKKPLDPSAAVSAALAYFPVLPEALAVHCTSIELSAPLGGLRAAAPGAKPTRKRRHSLMHLSLSPADGSMWSQQATIPYLSTCMRLMRLRGTLAGKPARSFSSSVDTLARALELQFGQPSGLTVKLAACNAVSRAQAASAVAAGVSDAADAAMQPQAGAHDSCAADQPTSDRLGSPGAEQLPASPCALQQSGTTAPHETTQGHEHGFNSQQLSHHSDPQADSSTATGVMDGASGDISGGVHGCASDAVDSVGMISDSGKASAMAVAAAPSVFDPSTLENTSHALGSGALQGAGGTGELGSTRAASIGDSTGQFVDATESGVHEEPEKSETPKTQAGVSPRGRRGRRRRNPRRHTVSVEVSTGALVMSAMGGSLSLYNGESKSTLLVDGPAGGRFGEAQAVSVGLGMKDVHAACLCASLRSFEEGHHVLQTLSRPSGSRAGASPAAESSSGTAAGDIGGGGATAGAAVPSVAEDPPRGSAAHKSTPPVCKTSSRPGAVSGGSSGGAQSPVQGERGASRAQQTVSAALKGTSWRLNLQVDDETSLLVVDGGSRDAEKMFGKPEGPNCKTLIVQGGRCAAEVGAGPGGCRLPIHIRGMLSFSLSPSMLRTLTEDVFRLVRNL